MGKKRLTDFDLPAEVWEAIEDKVKTKMKSACGMVVNIVRAAEEKYGAEGKEVCRQAVAGKTRATRQPGDPQEDLAKFIEGLDDGCTVSHQWERVVDEPDRIQYRFTRCMWAEVFRELDAADIGMWICEGDEPALKAYNPGLGFERTKVLMLGDDCCDHAYFVEESAKE